MKILKEFVRSVREDRASDALECLREAVQTIQSGRIDEHAPGSKTILEQAYESALATVDEDHTEKMTTLMEQVVERIDEEHADMLERVIEKIDRDHAAKLKQVIQICMEMADGKQPQLVGQLEPVNPDDVEVDDSETMDAGADVEGGAEVPPMEDGAAEIIVGDETDADADGDIADDAEAGEDESEEHEAGESEEFETGEHEESEEIAAKVKEILDNATEDDDLESIKAQILAIVNGESEDEESEEGDETEEVEVGDEEPELDEPEAEGTEETEGEREELETSETPEIPEDEEAEQANKPEIE